MVKKVLVCLRSISGGGKSFLARELLKKEPQGTIVSADLFWGEAYKFDLSYLGLAHDWCFGEVVRKMFYAVSPIILDNTNSTSREAERYISAAKKFGYAVEVLEPDTTWKFDVNECFRRNSHSVPLHTLQRMLARWEPDEVFKRKLGLLT